jgi:hypothetical protein
MKNFPIFVLFAVFQVNINTSFLIIAQNSNVAIERLYQCVLSERLLSSYEQALFFYLFDFYFYFCGFQHTTCIE